ncbi:unnamed protein product [Clavelina lepadiformis]|uniref:Uncharacterized protein n=1 Tax=Clavelina lepadiformis TaxID=159417 RepID=A0ABP0GYD5_CLALP
MGTISHENYTFSLGFSRADASSPDTTRDVVLYGAHVPISGRTDSRVAAPYQEKRTLPGTHASVSEFVCVAALGAEAPISVSRFGNINPIPFRTTGATRASPRFRTAFAYPLGSTDPCSTAVHMEPFSTSAFKFTIFRVPTRTLSLDPSDKRIESAGDAPTAGAAGSHLRRTTPAFAFTTPCGFRTAPRLAHMLDSLVRVSRRVGKVADISRGPRAPRATTPTPQQSSDSRALRTVPGRPTPRSARAPGHPKAPDAAISPRPDGGSYDRAPIALARRRVTLRAAF